MLWQLLTLEPLYPGMSLFDVMENVVHRNARPSIPMKWSANLRDIIESGWHPISRKRCTAREMMHALLLEYKEQQQDEEEEEEKRGDTIMLMPQ